MPGDNLCHLEASGFASNADMGYYAGFKLGQSKNAHLLKRSTSMEKS
jgi:hypothetical protein